ncbi:divisome protein SepX/GlpR [Nocardioides daeguensis]|uniref:DUF3040 domain-containing protein n=1 Tax=Nocardioides daeguensis TaxID=908359 RepID=A0ABP6V0Z5_9ACTN|nr:hypothetical protein [Nocardioides daeguensis]MBV6727173.1 hypothetical protein [Nocardioides daeguensis]MCR1771187.1 hypothetical protein [Nocardioides daeguensis]
MDLSSLIFVAVVVAWAVYLVPMALRRHEEDASSRSVEGFSDRLRVLARREAVSSTEAELVAAGRPVQESRDETRDEEPAAPTPAPRAARSADAPVEVPVEVPAAESTAQRRLRQSAAARRAAARRRRVFNLLLLAIVLVAALAIGKVVDWVWLAAPVTLMAAWLVACRLMVKRERAARATPVRKRRTTLADEVIADEDASKDTDDADEVRDDTDEIAVVTAEVLDEPAEAAPATPVVDGWTPVPVPLPTYVAKAPAGRTVRTIDLDSTGVWSSGRNEADSQLAREADAQRAQADAAAADAEQRRATGS